MHIKTNKMASKAMDEKAESLSELGSHLNGVFYLFRALQWMVEKWKVQNL